MNLNDRTKICTRIYHTHQDYPNYSHSLKPKSYNDKYHFNITRN